MKKYDNLLSTIEVYLSAEAGASAESIAALERLLANDASWREDLREELAESLADPNFSWRRALWSEYCHVSDEESEESARDYITTQVLRRIEKAAMAL